jgi:hypothetical protein
MSGWRQQIRAVRAALREAESLRGVERRHALIRVCRGVVALEAPGWRRRPNGEDYRVETADTRAYDRAEWRLELEVGSAIKDCIGCVAMRPLPEDREGPVGNKAKKTEHAGREERRRIQGPPGGCEARVRESGAIGESRRQTSAPRREPATE